MDERTTALQQKFIQLKIRATPKTKLHIAPPTNLGDISTNVLTMKQIKKQLQQALRCFNKPPLTAFSANRSFLNITRYYI